MGDYTALSPTVSHGISDTVSLLFDEGSAVNHSKRLTAYRKYWLYYLGKHWSYSRDPGEPTLTINWCRRIVDMHTDFAFKNGFNIVIPDDPSTEKNETKDRKFIQHMLDESWRKNGKYLWMLTAGQQGGVTGDVFARVSYEKADPLEDPYPRADIMPSHLCFPEFGGPYGVDRKKLKRILIIIPSFKETNKPPMVGAFVRRGTKTNPKIELVFNSEEWTSPVIDPKTGDIKEPAKLTRYKNKEIVSKEINILGEIPVVHIPNYPLADEFYGLSDLVDAVELNREFNEKATDISDIINYHASPVTIIKGAKLSSLEKGANRMWGIPGDADAKNLEMEGDLPAANKHLDSLKQYILELTGTPEQALGEQVHISNATGVALQIQYMPMLERRNVKVLTYGHGIRLINRLMIKTAAIGDSGFGKKLEGVEGNKYRNDVIFPDPMPQDERRDLEISRERMDQRLSHRRLELEKMGYSEPQIDAIMEGVRKDMEEEAEFMFSAPGTSPGRGKATFNRGGFGDTLGEKIDDDLQDK
jgi:hypothetical protein